MAKFFSLKGHRRCPPPRTPVCIYIDNISFKIFFLKANFFNKPVLYFQLRRGNDAHRGPSLRHGPLRRRLPSLAASGRRHHRRRNRHQQDGACPQKSLRSGSPFNKLKTENINRMITIAKFTVLDITLNVLTNPYYVLLTESPAMPICKSDLTF